VDNDRYEIEFLKNLFYNKSSDLFPNVIPQSGIEKFIQFPLIRLIIILILLAPSPIIFRIIRDVFNKIFDAALSLYLGYLLDVLLIISLVVIYNIYTKTVENRKAHELSFNKFSIELGFGAALAVIAITFFVIVNYLLGYYSIEKFNSFGNVVFMFFDQLKVGFIEELLFRVILFKLTEEILGSWSAIAIQGVLFGFAHSGNPNASIYTTIALIIAFSIFFAAGFMMTRRIWFIFGFHWFWNFFQAGIFGIQNSGHIQPSLITPNIDGPIWITGGDWGAELSVISIVILFSVSLYFVKIVSQRNQFITASWRR